MVISIQLIFYFINIYHKIIVKNIIFFSNVFLRVFLLRYITMYSKKKNIFSVIIFWRHFIVRSIFYEYGSLPKTPYSVFEIRPIFRSRIVRNNMSLVNGVYFSNFCKIHFLKKKRAPKSQNELSVWFYYHNFKKLNAGFRFLW